MKLLEKEDLDLQELNNMWTDNQFEILRETLDLRKSEIYSIKQALEHFPIKIEYNDIDWEMIKETWNMFLNADEYPIHNIILDNWCDLYLKDIITDSIEDYVVFYCIDTNTIIINGTQINDEFKIELENKLHNKFNLELDLENRLYNKFNLELDLWD